MTARRSFKGGTSLSKGWDLIERFSEDVDIFLDPLAFRPVLGARAINRELKRLRDSLNAHPALAFLKEGSNTIGGFGRSDRFVYAQRFGGPGEVSGQVLVEAGTASGREPTETVELRSYLATFLSEQGLSLEAEDEGSWVRLFFVGGRISLCGSEAGGNWIRHGVVREQRRGPVADGTCAVSDGWGCSAGTRALGGGSQYASMRRRPVAA